MREVVCSVSICYQGNGSRGVVFLGGMCELCGHDTWFVVMGCKFLSMFDLGMRGSRLSLAFRRILG